MEHLAEEMHSAKGIEEDAEDVEQHRKDQKRTLRPDGRETFVSSAKGEEVQPWSGQFLGHQDAHRERSTAMADPEHCPCGENRMM